MSWQRSQAWTGNLILLFVSISIGFVVLEGLSRVFFPVSPGNRILSEDGQPVVIDRGGSRLPQNLRFRQVAHEFDALATTTDLGYRGPPAHGQPEIIFLGDSFTFGTGLRDEQTFAFLYCQSQQISCANLGRGGTGTMRQLDILEDFLEKEGWRPREVKLFMLVSTSALMGGNDLADNLSEAASASTRSPAGQEEVQEQMVPLQSIIDARREILAWSNLIRAIYFVWGPYLRMMLSPEPEGNRLQTALDQTQRQLDRFQSLAQSYGFEAKIYLLHPVQDLLAESYPQTITAMRAIAPDGVRVVSTACALLDEPEAYYFNYNGHFNPEGARRVAAFLSAEKMASASCARRTGASSALG